MSLVAASRNDNHGGDPLQRTKIFIDCFARQCEKYKIPAEIILVDWNPVPDRPGLSAELEMPSDVSYCSGRVISVPSVLHRRIKYGDRFPFFQMIAKNVGICRARGQFVIATNIDIIFSDELMHFIGQKQLDPKRQYRVDRFDIESGLSENTPLDETIAYAWEHPVRQNRRFGPSRLVKQLYGKESIKRKCDVDPDTFGKIQGIQLEKQNGTWLIHSDRNSPMENIHTNACGDYTLMSSEAWRRIRGYPEFEAYSFNIDSMGILAAHYDGVEEVFLPPPCVCFHIEHSKGSGWSPEGANVLFNRLKKMRIISPEWSVLIPLVNEMREGQKALEFNSELWGFQDLQLPERELGSDVEVSGEEMKLIDQRAKTHSGSALHPHYDYDMLSIQGAKPTPLLQLAEDMDAVGSGAKGAVLVLVVVARYVFLGFGRLTRRIIRRVVRIFR